MWSGLQLLGEAQQRDQGLKLYGRVRAELSMDSPQVSGLDQSKEGRTEMVTNHGPKL